MNSLQNNNTFFFLLLLLLLLGKEAKIFLFIGNSSLPMISGVGFTAATAGRETGRGRECDNDDDLENGKEKKREKEPPVDWERWEPIRTRILLLVSSSAFLAVMASSSVVPALDPIRESFDTTDTIVSLTSSLFFLSQVCGEREREREEREKRGKEREERERERREKERERKRDFFFFSFSQFLKKKKNQFFKKIGSL